MKQGYHAGDAGNVRSNCTVPAAEPVVEISDSGTEAFALWGEDETLILCNDAFRRLCGNASDTLKPGTEFQEFVANLVRCNAVTQVSDWNDDWIGERLARFRSPKGPFLQHGADGHWYRVREERMDTGHTMTIAVDITVQNQRAAKDREKTRMLESVFEAIPSLISVKDPQGCFLQVNKALTDRMLVPAWKHIGRTTKEVYATQSPTEIQRLTQQAVAAKRPILNIERMPDAIVSDGILISNIIPVMDKNTQVEFIVTVAHDITELKRNEEELDTQKNLFHSILDSIDAGVALKDGQGRYIMVNKRLAEVANMAAEDFVGKRASDLFSGPLGTELDTLTMEIAETGKPVQGLEITIPRSGKTYAHYMNPIAGADGKIDQIVTVQIDVTERNDAQNAMAKQRQMLQHIIDNIPARIAMRDKELRFVFANNGVAEAYSFELDDIIGKNFAEVFGDKENELEEMIKSVMATGQPVLGFERPARFNPDIVLRRNVIPIYGESGELEHVMTVSIDVSDRKRAEDELARQKDLLQQMVDAMPLSMSLKDAGNRFVLVNAQLAKNTNMPASDFIGKTTKEIFGDAYADRQEEWIQQVRTAGLPILNIEHESLIRNGEHFLQSIVPILSKDGDIELIATLSANITDRKRVEAELEEHRANLSELVDARTNELRNTQDELVSAERLATIGRMIATVSHELRNPLGTITTSVEILSETAKAKNEPLPRAFGRIERAAQRCLRIIEDLLQHTRTPEVYKQRLCIGDWCRTFHDDLAAPNGVEIVLNVQTNIEIDFDPDRMHQVMFNLLQNAWQAMTEAASSKPVIRIDIAERSGTVELRITDTGPGIPPENRDKIFEPLFSSKSLGYGLGLPLVKQLVELHDGKLYLADSGAGAEFVIELPCISTA